MCCRMCPQTIQSDIEVAPVELGRRITDPVDDRQ
jgi:hypothetical protein